MGRRSVDTVCNGMRVSGGGCSPLMSSRLLTNVALPGLVGLALSVTWFAQPVAAQASASHGRTSKVVGTAARASYRPAGCVPGPVASRYVWRLLSIEWKYWRGKMTPAQRRQEHRKAVRESLVPPGWRAVHKAYRSAKKWFFGR